MRPDMKIYTPTLIHKPLQGASLCFDLDGTLVDTAPDLVRVTNEMIAIRGHGPTHYPTARRAVGYGARRLMRDALTRAGDTADESVLDEMVQRFLDRYAESIAHHSEEFPMMVETLKALRADGATLSVCTNKPGWLARPLLDEMGLSYLFETVIGGDEAPKAKPDPRHIYAAVGHRDSRRIAMIGDSFPDVRSARNAGALSVLLRHGYSPVAPRRLKADLTLSSFREIRLALISRWRSGSGFINRL